MRRQSSLITTASSVNRNIDNSAYDNILTIKEVIPNINIVADDIANVNITATNIADINLVALNMEDIQNATVGFTNIIYGVGAPTASTNPANGTNSIYVDTATNLLLP